MNKKVLNGLLVVASIMLLSACGNDPEDPGRTFMPDMQYSQAYETYADNPNFQDGKTARLPAEGSIPRGSLPAQVQPGENQEAYHSSYFYQRYYENTPEGYQLAGEQLKNPLEPTDEVLAEGARIYGIFCAVCHGGDGGGRGSIVETGAYPIVPPYDFLLQDKPEGKMYHSITYGRNNMGSYASQITPEERWMVIYYIQQMTKTGPFAEEATSEETETAPQDTSNTGS